MAANSSDGEQPQGPQAGDADVTEAVEWQTDDEGREFFVEEGVRYFLAEDGYAYAEDQVPPDVTLVRRVEAGPDDMTSQAAPDSPKVEQAPAELDGSQEVEQSPDEPDGSQFSQHGQAQLEEREAPAAPAVAAVDALLTLSELKSGYGSLPVLHGVDIEIRRGETAVLLGLNGAGKTTTALNVSGALKAWSGTITFDGQDITDWGTRKCVNGGIVMVPEGRRVFPDLTVGKNLQIGAWTQRRESDWLEQSRERVFDYFPRLRERVNQLAGTLSGGEQQMLAVGRGLMANPKLLIIDEASMGLAPVIVQDVFDIVSQINEDGVTVLMIEQNVGALDVADLGLVMEQGRIVKELRGERLKDRSEVSEVLMG